MATAIESTTTSSSSINDNNNNKINGMNKNDTVTSSLLTDHHHNNNTHNGSSPFHEQHQFDQKIEKALGIVRNGSKNVHLNNMDINDEMMTPLCNELIKYKHLECIYLYVNRIGAQGIKKLVHLMKSLKSVKYLHLGGNQIGDEGLNEIASFIKEDKVLEHLAVGNVFSCYPEHGASISDDALINFANAVVGNTSLKILGLGGKKLVTNASFSALKNMLLNSCIKQIDVAGTGLSEAHQEELHKIADLPYEDRNIGKVLGLKQPLDPSMTNETSSDSSNSELKIQKEKNHHKKAKNGKIPQKLDENEDNDNDDDNNSNDEEVDEKDTRQNKKQKRNQKSVKKEPKKKQKVVKSKPPTRHSTRARKSA